jgi:hypothetical protein
LVSRMDRSISIPESIGSSFHEPLLTMERMSQVDAYHISLSSNTSTDAGGNGNGNANENGSGNENAPIYVQRDERNASIEVWKYEIMEV